MILKGIHPENNIIWANKKLEYRNERIRMSTCVSLCIETCYCSHVNDNNFMLFINRHNLATMQAPIMLGCLINIYLKYIPNITSFNILLLMTAIA